MIVPHRRTHRIADVAHWSEQALEHLRIQQHETSVGRDFTSPRRGEVKRGVPGVAPPMGY
jgi:hypothetical protein